MALAASSVAPVRVTVNVTAVPSATAWPLIARVGATSSLVIVIVPSGTRIARPAVGLESWSTMVSSASNTVSPTIVKGTVADVAFMGNVAVAAAKAV